MLSVSFMLVVLVVPGVILGCCSPVYLLDVVG